MSRSEVAKQEIAGVILAGGRGRRMGGCDKGLVELDGKVLAVRVRTRLASQVMPLLLVANRSFEQYRQLGFEVQQDVVDGYPGPLAGLLTGLQQMPGDWVLFSPCDTPWLPEDLAVRLWQAADAQGVSIAVAHDGEQAHWLCCLLHRSLQADLESALQDDIRSVQQWLARHAYALADFSDQPVAFTNLNTVAELAQAGNKPPLATG